MTVNTRLDKLAAAIAPDALPVAVVYEHEGRYYADSCFRQAITEAEYAELDAKNQVILVCYVKAETG